MINNLKNILEEINSKNDTVIKNRMDLINYISKFRDFLHTETERADYARVLLVLKDNKVIDEELFIMLCIRKFIQEFKLITDNLNDEKVVKYLKEKAECEYKHEQYNEYVQKQYANNSESKIEPIEPEMVINCNYDNNYNKSPNKNTDMHVAVPYYTSVPDKISVYVNDNIEIEKNPVDHDDSNTAIDNVANSNITVTYTDLKIRKRKHYNRKEKTQNTDNINNIDNTGDDSNG